jgi:hypothetical protein
MNTRKQLPGEVIARFLNRAEHGLKKAMFACRKASMGQSCACGE